MAVRDSAFHFDWINFRNFPGYKLKIKIFLRLTKRGDQNFILIFTILKLSDIQDDISSPTFKRMPELVKIGMS